MNWIICEDYVWEEQQILEFFSIKTYHLLESVGSARIEGNNTTVAEYIETKLEKDKNIPPSINLKKAIEIVQSISIPYSVRLLAKINIHQIGEWLFLLKQNTKNAITASKKRIFVSKPTLVYHVGISVIIVYLFVTYCNNQNTLKKTPVFNYFTTLIDIV